MKRKILSFIMVLAMILTILPASAVTVSAARAVIASGECGDNLTWVLYEDGELVISGEGEMDYGEWGYYQSQITTITIENGVTSIGDSAFYDCRSLTSITIPNSVTSIGDSVFSNCTRLTSIEIPDGVTSIGDCAFYDCRSLTSINIPDSVTSIGDSAFYGCLSLTDVYYGGTEEEWSAIAIDAGNERLTNATIHFTEPERVIIASGECGANLTWVLYEDGELVISGTGEMDDWHYLGYAPWYDYNDSIYTATIEAGVTRIGNYAFYGYAVLTSITIPETVTWIDYRAFGGLCPNLISIDVAYNNPDYTSLDGVLYDKDLTMLICYPDGREGEYTIPDSVTSIDYMAFYGCEGLTSITIPDSVTSIDYWAFSDCTSLTSITIPDGVTDLGEGMFNGCTSLASVTIPDSVTRFGNYAFLNCESLTSITIPNSVTSIGVMAFEYCKSLTSISIPDSVTSIGDYAFRDCTSLTSINVEENNNYYSSINGVLFNENKTEIVCCPGGKVGEYEIPDSVTSIGNEAFRFCYNLTSIEIPDSVTSIGDDAFGYCESLTSIAIPDSVTSIGDDAFWGCSSLTSITIPNSVTSIGGYAFYGCLSLTDVYYGGTEEEWSAIAIDVGNERLTNATIHFVNPPIVGDVNGDGVVNIQDVIILINHVNNSSLLSDVSLCDVTGDGEVNILDIIRILKHVNNSLPLN